MALGKKVFVQKSVGGTLYKWSPQPNNVTKKSINGEIKKPYFCEALAGSNGQDWITTYVYELQLVNYQQARLAYVSCGYVE